jgi:large subunit ribosomal protein L24
MMPRRRGGCGIDSGFVQVFPRFPDRDRGRKGDLVQVVAGADRGKQGRVIAVDRSTGKLRVQKIRLQKRHLKPGRRVAKTGGIIELEGYVDASNVMLVDPSTGKPDRVRTRIVEDERVRVFAKSGEKVPPPQAT